MNTHVSFEIKSSALPSHATVAAFRGSEGISRPYVFDVYVNVIGEEEVEIDDAPGSRATLLINDPKGSPIRVDGIIAQAELLQAIHDKAQAPNTLYLVRIVPTVWQLSLTKHSRIWTNMTIPDVIKELLEEEGVHRVDMRLQSTYEVEEHVCQYKESSLNFIHRWMEREGMYYFFEQSDDGETLVITDNKAASSLSRLLPIPYHPGAHGDKGALAHLDTFTWRHAALPADVRYVEYDYTKPMLEVSGQAPVSPIGVGEQVVYGNRFFSTKQGNALATVRAEDLRARAKTFHGSGPVLGITSGYFFILEGHPKLQMNMEYLAVTVEHYGFMHGAADTWGKLIPHDYTETYRVDVVAIDANQQYRHPEVAPWPRLDGYENAVIDGPATSDYAQIDSHGRYNLKFKFDEGTFKNGKASTWVRKMQPHAGTVEGWHFPERAGTEVICAFLGGDPDRPIIIGAIPTAIHPSPVTAANHTKNVIQTGGLNRFEFEDLAGQQRITMQTPTQSTHIIMGDPVGGDHFIARTQGCSLHHTDGDHDSYVGGNHTELVEAELQQTVQAAVTHLFNATLTQTVQAAVTKTFNSTETKTVLADVMHTYLANHIQEIAGDVTKKIGGTQQKSITGDDIMNLIGNKVHEIAANEAEKVGGDVKKEIAGEKQETIGGSFKNLISGDWITNIGGAEQTTTAGIKIETVLGAAIDNVLGARIDTTLGIVGEIAAGLHFELAPSKVNFEITRNGIHAMKDEVAGLKNDLSGMDEKIKGLTNMCGGLYDVAIGMNNLDAGMVNIETALQSVMAALIDLA